LSDSSGHERERGAVRRAFGRAAPAYDGAAELQRETGAELLDRLAPVRITPARAIDLGCGTGEMTRGLARLYARALVVGVDFAPAMLARLGARRLFGNRPRPLTGDIRQLPFADASVDLVVSNLAFQWIDDLAALFSEVRRVLRPEGVLMFSTFGPDTLHELRTAWAEVDDTVHVHTFADMHDIGDAMLAAGLRDPVMDVDRVQRDYPDVASLMRGLKAIGATNAHPARRRGLTGRRRLAALEAAYTERGSDGGPRATWELVFGHAWGAQTSRPGRGDAREFRISADSIGRRKPNP